MILLDSGGLFAALVESELAHKGVRAAIENDPGPLILSPVALCEVDHLLLTRAGVAVEAAFLREVAQGAFELASFGAEDVDAAVGIIERYHDFGIGLADASIVVLAGRYDTNRVLTLDERHFRAMRTPRGDPFMILPADA